MILKIIGLSLYSFAVGAVSSCLIMSLMARALIECLLCCLGIIILMSGAISFANQLLAEEEHDS